MNKNKGFAPIIIIIAIVIVAAVAGAVYLGVRNENVRLDDTGSAEVDSNTTVESNADVNTQTNVSVGVSGSVGAYANVKAALDSGKSLKCTYSISTGPSTSVGTFYIADGKVRQESGSVQVTTVIVLADGKVYMWNDLKAVPDVIVQPAAEQIVTVINRTPLDKFSCREETIPDSVFGPPAGANIMGIGL